MLIALTNELRSMVGHCAFTIHKHNHYSLNIVGDSQSYIIHQQETHTEAAPAAAAKEQSRKASKTHNGINTGGAESCLCVTHRIFDGPFGSLERHAPPILLFWSLLLASIWKQTRQGAHYIHVPLSPACHKLPFPSPVGRQLIRQQWASQPASNVSCERPDHFRSLYLSCSRSAATLLLFLSLSLSIALSSPSSASPPFLAPFSSWPAVQRNGRGWKLPPLPLTADGDQTDLHQGTADLIASPRRGEGGGFRWEAGRAKLETEGKKRKRGAELECGWRGRKGSMLHVGWVMEGCSMEQWQLKRKKCSVWGVGVKNDIYNVSTLLFLEGPGRYVKEVEGRANLWWMAEDNRRAIAATEVLVREHEKCMIWEKMGRLG